MLSGWRRTLSKCFLIPQRYVLGLMGFLSVVNAYSMRVSLSIAITEMAVDNSSGSTTKPEDSDKYDWDSTTQGLILSSFYWGYVLTHIPGGLLAERFGGKYSLSLGILSTAFFTLITPWIIRSSDGDWRLLVALRVLAGLGEGTTYPALNTLLARWVPLAERSKLGTLVYAGGQIGTVFSNAVGGALIAATNDWASVFYLFGSLGALWFFAFVLLCYSTPEQHPFISDEEKQFLKEELASQPCKKSHIPWKAILSSVPLWALVCAQIGHDWGFFTMVTDLPSYLKDTLHFSVEDNGLWSSLPYIVMWLVSMGSGWLCDWLIQKQYMGITFARKFFTTIASIGPAVFIVVASYCGNDATLSVAMFTIAMGFMGTFYCGMKVNALDLSPNYAGTLMAVVNGIGAITGIVAPYLAGALTENHTLEEWRVVFWISFGIFCVANVVYVLFASGEEQWWNKSESREQDNRLYIATIPDEKLTIKEV